MEQELSQHLEVGCLVLYTPRYLPANRDYPPLYEVGQVIKFTSYRALVRFTSIVAFFPHWSLTRIQEVYSLDPWGLQ